MTSYACEQDFSIINDYPDGERPEITFSLRPCSGSAFMFITPVQYPWPTNETAIWRSDDSAEVNELSVPLLHAEYFVSVYGEQDSTYEVATFFSGKNFILLFLLYYG